MRAEAGLLAAMACGPPADEADAAAPIGPEVERGLLAARPDALIDLLEVPATLLPSDPGCPPAVEVDESGRRVRETWQGTCLLADNALMQGRLSAQDSAEGATLMGEAFSLRREGRLEFYLDGTLEVERLDELMLVDAALSWCGGTGPSCEDGPIALGLSWSIWPASQFPVRAAVTVSGALGTGAEVYVVDGSWRMAEDVCPTEPIDGEVAIRGGRRHTVLLDGHQSCDGCARWTVGGRPGSLHCGLAW